jgi:hypothetical protein
VEIDRIGFRFQRDLALVRHRNQFREGVQAGLG